MTPKKHAAVCSDCFATIVGATKHRCEDCEGFVCDSCVVRDKGRVFCATGPMCGTPGPGREIHFRRDPEDWKTMRMTCGEDALVEAQHDDS